LQSKFAEKSERKAAVERWEEGTGFEIERGGLGGWNCTGEEKAAARGRVSAAYAR